LCPAWLTPGLEKKIDGHTENQKNADVGKGLKIIGRVKDNVAVHKDLLVMFVFIPGLRTRL
jgi:hypothetical protein